MPLKKEAVTAVVAEAHASGLARTPRPDDIEAAVRACMFEPVYRDYA